jgi:1,2-diacylglycerol 3-alpha-glucosyltransferase
MVAYLSRERLKHVSAIIAPTKKTEEVLKKYRIKKDIVVVPTGIPLERYQTRISQEERSEMRNNLGIFDDNFLLVYLGRVGTEKKIDEVLKLFAKARQINKKLMFMIVGDGPSKGDFERLAESLGVSDAVVFTGMVDHEDVHKYYQLGDVFVSGSTSETQGLTYIEAAANGLPLLCRKDPCLENVIFQGENGYQYETDEEFFEYLSLAHNDEWRKTASKKSEKVAESFGTTIFGDQIEKVYASVLENK